LKRPTERVDETLFHLVDGSLQLDLVKENKVGMADKGRILFVVGSLMIGGAESQLAMLAERLKSRGWAVEVFLLERTGALVAQLERSGIRLSDGGYRSARGTKAGKIIALCLCEARLVWRILRSRPEVVHGFLPITDCMSAIAGRMAFAPLAVTSKRSLSRHRDRHPGLKWPDRVANALSHVVTANSRAVADDVQARDGYDVSRVVVIPNGLDFTRFDNARDRRDQTRNELGLSNTDIAIAMVANLIPYKGHAELIEAFAQNAARDTRLRLFLIGRDDSIAKDLMSIARRLGVADRISLMGERSDVPTLLLAMDLGVMSSHEEGFSNALLEKLAAGLPVVATNVGGNPEALEAMPDCILVQPRNAEDLARGMTWVIGRLSAAKNSRETRQRLVRERYSVEAMVDAYEQLYTGGARR
jgi:glycosyltransferase involved in cell wall biosynthesis